MTEQNKLLPCPFCGAPAMWKDGIPKNSPVGYVKCSNECCGFYICNEHKVWKNPSCWNTRAESEVSRYKVALELASDKLSALESKYAKDGLQKFAAEFSRIKSKITQALEKEEK